MNKNILIVIIIVLLVVISVGAYFMTKDKSTNTNTNSSATNANSQNTNVSLLQVNYEIFSNEGELVAFKHPTEWIKIMPEEIMKTSTLEQRNYYNIIHYSSNTEGASLVVSKKSLDQGTNTLEEVVNNDQEFANKTIPDYELIGQDIYEDRGLYSARYTAQGINYITDSKELKINEGGLDWFYIAEVSFPEDLKSKYSQITAEILDSFLAR